MHRFLAYTFGALLLFGAVGFGPEPAVTSPISAAEFVRAMTSHRGSVLDLYFTTKANPNARADQDRPILLVATLQQDWPIVQRLLNAGASVDLADGSGLTPMMAAARLGRVDILREFVGQVTRLDVPDRHGMTVLHHAIAAKQKEALEFLLQFFPDLNSLGSDLLAAAIEAGDPQITQFLLDRLPKLPQWTASTRRVLFDAIAANDRDRIRLLLGRHAVPPTPEGKNVPLFAYAIASKDARLFTTLLECGSDPNMTLPDKSDPEFLALLPSQLSAYVTEDRAVNMLMVAAATGEPDYVRALLAAGGDKNRPTSKYKMIPLYIAAQTGKWRCTQVLLGGGPDPEQLRIEISLASQKVALIKGGSPVFATVCSTGRPGFATKRGDFVITDKQRVHRSTIYHVDMPYFMRLSCLDFGMHEGVVPNYPASHGCIRLPGDAARKFFSEIPVGTLVSVK